MSHGLAQLQDYTSIGNLEQDRRQALLTLLDEVNSTLAYLEDHPCEPMSSADFMKIENAYFKVTDLFDVDLDKCGYPAIHARRVSRLL